MMHEGNFEDKDKERKRVLFLIRKKKRIEESDQASEENL